MKKMVSSLLMTSALLLGAVAPVVANAADTTAEENRGGITDSTVSFTENKSTVDPVDPEDPNKPLTPKPDENGNGAASGGGLSFIYAPKTIDFGTHEIDVQNNQKYSALTANTATQGNTTELGSSKKVGLQVSDVRGTNKGWTLSVTSSDGTDGNISSLKGATITLPTGKVTSSGDVASDSTDATGATAGNGAVSVKGIINVDSSAVAGTGNTDTDFNGATSAEVLKAADTKGSGVTSDLLDPTELTLNVIANTASAKTYSGQLNWTLSSVADK